MSLRSFASIKKLYLKSKKLQMDYILNIHTATEQAIVTICNGETSFGYDDK